MTRAKGHVSVITKIVLARELRLALLCDTHTHKYRLICKNWNISIHCGKASHMVRDCPLRSDDVNRPATSSAGSTSVARSRAASYLICLLCMFALEPSVSAWPGLSDDCLESFCQPAFVPPEEIPYVLWSCFVNNFWESKVLRSSETSCARATVCVCKTSEEFSSNPSKKMSQSNDEIKLSRVNHSISIESTLINKKRLQRPKPVEKKIVFRFGAILPFDSNLLFHAPYRSDFEGEVMLSHPPGKRVPWVRRLPLRDRGALISCNPKESSGHSLTQTEEESFLDSVRHQFVNRRWVRTTRGSSRRLVKIENLERLSESDPEIMANNASHRGTRNPLYDGDNEESTGFNH
ncbi:hypothetical protein HYC85_017619 [Camellia sinensis]|uniref:Uncharacterized protein n=1 Tax=Camellia sinensis TaxID=4442 RepID=A0A7J7GRX7_CAMSI|nr:hypothetical protein HYC85_017619 [Camellia sinensis]